MALGAHGARPVVALRALGVGDLLTAVPALRALRGAHPGRRVVVAAPESLRPLAQLAGVELVHATALAPLPRRLHGAELLVNLHGRGPQSHAVALAARPRRLVAFRHPDHPWSLDLPEWHAAEHEVARWCRLLTETGIPADPSALALPQPPGTRDHGATVIHPGAASPARRWPAARFAAVARAEVAAGRAVLVTGGLGERGLAREVAERARLPDAAVLAGRTSLGELAAIVAGARRVICGDTGVAHLATAFGVPSVVLFGPTPPAEWGPSAERRDLHRVIWAGAAGDPHADAPHDGLLAITVEDVLAELEALPALAHAHA